MKYIISIIAIVIFFFSESYGQTDGSKRHSKISTSQSSSRRNNNSTKSNRANTNNSSSKASKETFKASFSNGILVVNDISYVLVKVEGGSFIMGTPSNDEKRAWDIAHKVTLTNDYYIGQTEVTQAIWTAVMGSNPSMFKGKNKPVEHVSWNDCKIFISKLNKMTGEKFRLPTEAEWEFAARGGNNSNNYKYSGSNYSDDVAWHNGNSENSTHEVASKQPNELGIYDMSGNVWEWCEDWYDRYNSSAQTNPKGPVKGFYRVFRGSSWNSYLQFCTPMYRNSYEPDTKGAIGFRLAITE